MTALFTPKYEAKLREHFVQPNPQHYLIGALRVALEPGTFNGVAMARGIMAIYDEMKEGKS